MKLRVAFDLDETLGVTLVDDDSITGFQLRAGAMELLQRLSQKCTLILWSVGRRSYIEKVLSYGLGRYFIEVYSWDEIASDWKDVRAIKADYLIDDSPHHLEHARSHHLEKHYIVVAAYRSPEDRQDPLLWARQIEKLLVPETAK